MKVLETGVTGAKWAGAVGLVCGVFYSFGGLIVDLLTTGLNAGTWMAFGALIGMPVIFGFWGFLAGVLLALVANGVGAVADRMGR